AVCHPLVHAARLSAPQSAGAPGRRPLRRALDGYSASRLTQRPGANRPEDVIEDELVSALPAGRVITDPDQIAAYCHDEHSYVTPGRPCAVVVAHERHHVVTALRSASSHRVDLI